MNINRSFPSSPKKSAIGRVLPMTLERVRTEQRPGQQQSDDGRDVETTTDLRDDDDEAERHRELRQQRQRERV